ncbi:MAG: hypothetical protein A2W91_00325 [Bacteroidetes bacterium GWF2_38_335]|nr:MAG: hypothetical protein A2W91_00325 [Bacteroidetes bacterium GWF2_38_335]OFY78278.1 MAG: hypothetical protein A2281_03705 [Bacteroidetes bacterium RIFOXYA12_FULL_38_20]HBS87527.1 hypothetical protein [Bacteroidales bacterium]
MKKLYTLFIGLIFSIALIAQEGPKSAPITTNTTTYTITQLIQDVLINGCVEVTNITVTSGGGYGFFNGGGTTFPFNETDGGIMIASGAISNAVGPNTSGSLGSTLSTGSDPDLALLIPGYTINDATVIQFDFVPSSDTIMFEYIFGSEEYPEWVGSSFNDVFGFFLSGPGISGPYSGGAINIALIPGTSLPVTIDNVNAGSYSTYYIDNTVGSAQACQYDGYTVPLTAFAIVTACETYHIKLAVGDAGDSAYDSGVFFRAGSFDSGGNVLMENPDPIYGDNSEIFEGCQNYYVFSRLDTSPAALTDSIQVFLSYGGDAVMGSDYTSLPTSIWISAGEIYDTIFFEAFEDGVIEDLEYFTIDLLSGCPCSLESVSDTIWIIDYVVFKAGVTPHLLNYCNGAAPDSVMIEAYSDSHPSDFLYYQWSTGVSGPTDSIIWVYPSPGYNVYYATISDLCENNVTDSCVIIVSDLSASAVVSESNALCHDDCLGEMHVTAAGDSPPFSLSWYFFVSGTPAPAIDMTGLCPGFYSLKITDVLGCYRLFPFVINDPDLLEMDELIVTPDYGACSGTAWAGPTGGTAPYSYTWSAGGSTDYVTGLCFGMHTVTITDANGCTYTEVFSVPNMVNVGEIENSGISVYPNPSNNGNFLISFDKDFNNVSIDVLDVSGKIVKCEAVLQDKNTYLLTGISNGVYMLRIKSENEVILLQRIVVTE